MSDWKNVQYKDGKLRTSEGGGGGGSSTFAGLDDVNFSDLSDGQIPKYDSQTQKWVNANESGGGGASSMADLDDVDLTGISDGDTLVYDATNQEFIPGTPSGGGNVDDVEVNGTSVVNQNKVAQIVSYKEVTQSEYNALPASKESDGILYCISDAPGGVDGFPPLIYSEEEREIGVWRDGKPLYQKTISCGALPSSSSKTIAHGILNADQIVYCLGYAIDNNGGVLVLPYPSTGTSWITFDINRTNVIIYVGQNRSGYNGWLTLRYTKTTDTAGSAQWSTQGSYISSEVIQTTGNYDNNTQVTLSLTRKYANPYVYPVNALPLANWNNGARIVVQTDTISYDKTNNQLSFKVYVSSTQGYKVDWMITELGG